MELTVDVDSHAQVHEWNFNTSFNKRLPNHEDETVDQCIVVIASKGSLRVLNQVVHESVNKLFDVIFFVDHDSNALSLVNF